MAHNVPAVYDVFAVAIKEAVGFQQPQKCGGEKPHQGRSPTAVFRSPSRRSIYSPVMRRTRTLHYFFKFYMCIIFTILT
jgi:hypothetical protein